MPENDQESATASTATPDSQPKENAAETERQVERPVVGLGDLLADTAPTRPAKATSGRAQKKKPIKAPQARPTHATVSATSERQASNHTTTPSTEGERVTISFEEPKRHADDNVSATRRSGSFSTFVVLSVVGSIVLILPQSFGVPGIFKFFFAIAMVALYGGAGFVLQWYQPKRGGQRYIDNVYFLGFLYTQVGLVAGFMELWQSSNVDASGIRRITSDELIPIIAAALGASALGLLLKTILDEIYELRITSNSVTDEEKWRDELANSAAALKEEVDGVIGHFRALSTNVVNATRDITGAVQIASSTAGQVDTSGQNIAASVREIAPALQKFQATLVQAGERAAAGILEVQGDLSSATQSLKDIAGAAKGMNDVVAQMSGIVGQMDGVIGQMDGVVQTAKTASEVAENASNEFSEEARSRVSRLAERLEEITKSASGDARTGFSASVQKIDAELNKTRDELGRHVEKFATAVKAFNLKIDERR